MKLVCCGKEEVGRATKVPELVISYFMSCNIIYTHKLMRTQRFSLLCVHGRMVGPCAQCLLIGMRWLQSLWSIVLDVIVRPFLMSAGRCCGGFSIHLARE